MTEEKLIIAAVFAGVILFAAVKLVWGVAQWTRRTPHRIGDRFGDASATVTEWSGARGAVTIGGELWRAASKEALGPGDEVVVVNRKGLTLDVRKR